MLLLFSTTGQIVQGPNLLLLFAQNVLTPPVEAWSLAEGGGTAITSGERFAAFGSLNVGGGNANTAGNRPGFAISTAQGGGEATSTAYRVALATSTATGGGDAITSMELVVRRPRIRTGTRLRVRIEVGSG